MWTCVCVGGDYQVITVSNRHQNPALLILSVSL